MSKLTYSRELRLLTPAHFQRVFDNPVRASSPEVTLLARTNDLGHARLGLTIARKQVKKATSRNRLKRLSREYLRHRQATLPDADVIVIVKKPAQFLENSDYVALLDRLWKLLAKRLAHA
ncbi:ribonuclease P protein component [Gallaecimonas kandeliae]|uniref:ribonuclease P protein component n=1 Tax=Gallaecimonas kandeliae TaxID=3029055 RepID=UPI0026489468|nr:ribonuclease P protein component [Gallaecimonas kandeliae]WKE65680.1 ribonuclease P protein component [Gallaecimonas kandeliae]